MQEKYDINDVEDSFTKFDDLVSDLFDSEYSTFDSNLRRFLNHCENDEIMSIICNQLTLNMTILDKWWFGNHLDTPVSQVGSRKLNPPDDDDQKDALYYQLCLKINTGEIKLFGFCINFTNCSPHEAIIYFNKNIVNPLTRSMRRKLNKISSKVTVKKGNEGYISREAFYIYLDYSTIINGDVNTKGDTVIGGDASVEKKSII